MNELDILDLFYDAMKSRGTNREAVFLNIDDITVGVLSHRLGKPIRLQDAQKITDICIANEWLERTTIDPGYNFLSLTSAGLQIILASKYQNGVGGVNDI